MKLHCGHEMEDMLDAVQILKVSPACIDYLIWCERCYNNNRWKPNIFHSEQEIEAFHHYHYLREKVQ